MPEAYAGCAVVHLHLTGLGDQREAPSAESGDQVGADALIDSTAIDGGSREPGRRWVEAKRTALYLIVRVVVR